RVSSYLVKAYQIYLCCCKDWKLLFFDAAVLDVAATVSTACIIAAGYIVSAGICDAAGSFRYSFLLEDLEVVPADYVPAGHVLISADRYRIC
ncbi:hypothetical protein Tco_1507399, partial [Tanacetum coccineum]